MAAETVQIVSFPEGQRPYLDDREVEKVIKGSGMESLPTVLVSIGGVARSGKSFMLNLFVSYLSYVENVNRFYYPSIDRYYG